MAKLGRANKMKAKNRVTRQKKLTKPMQKAVTSIVKKTIRKEEETKFFIFSDTFERTGVLTTALSPQSYNIFYHGVSRGTGNNQLIGDKLRWKGIAIKYRIFNAYTDLNYVWNGQPVVFDIMVIRVPIYKVAISLTFNELRNDTSADPNTYFLNPDVKVLFKKTVRINPDRGQATAQQRQAVGKIWVKRNQMIEYKDYQVDQALKNNMNYYLVFLNRSPTSEKSQVTFSYQNYFTDA